MERHGIRVAPPILDLAPADEPLQEALFALEHKSVLKLDANEATIGPSPAVVAAIMTALKERPLNLCPDSCSRRLRRRLAQYTGMPQDWIACFSSEAAALEVVARTYLHPDCEVVLCWPSDTPFFALATASGAKVRLSTSEDIMNPQITDLIDQTSTRTRLIHIANPASPTGALFSESEIVFLASYAENSLLVVDESYYEFSGLSMVGLVEKIPNLMVIRTFSRAFCLAGLPTSYVITQPQNLRMLMRLGHHFAPSSLAQIAAEAALDDLDYVSRYVNRVNQAKQLLFDRLRRTAYRVHITCANFCLLDVGFDETVAKDLAKANIFVRRLTPFPGLESKIMMTVGTPQQMETVIAMLERRLAAMTPDLAPSDFDEIETDSRLQPVQSH